MHFKRVDSFILSGMARRVSARGVQSLAETLFTCNFLREKSHFPCLIHNFDISTSMLMYICQELLKFSIYLKLKKNINKLQFHTATSDQLGPAVSDTW